MAISSQSPIIFPESSSNTKAGHPNKKTFRGNQHFSYVAEIIPITQKKTPTRLRSEEAVPEEAPEVKESNATSYPVIPPVLTAKRTFSTLLAVLWESDICEARQFPPETPHYLWKSHGTVDLLLQCCTELDEEIDFSSIDFQSLHCTC